MLNHHAKPSIATPRKCIKCGGIIVTDTFYARGQIIDSFKCVNCGQVGESDFYWDAKLDRMRPVTT